MKPQVQYFLDCYLEQNIFEVAGTDISSRDYEICPTECVKKESSVIMNIGDQILEMAENHEENARIYASLNARQRQEIRALARNLRAAADSLQVRSPRSLLAIEKAILQNEGLREEEMKVVKNIHSIKTDITIPKVVDALNEKLTALTFRATLRFLCYSATSITEELTIMCELIKMIRPKIAEVTCKTNINEVISEFVGAKLDAVLH